MENVSFYDDDSDIKPKVQTASIHDDEVKISEIKKEIVSSSDAQNADDVEFEFDAESSCDDDDDNIDI